MFRNLLQQLPGEFLEGHSCCTMIQITILVPCLLLIASWGATVSQLQVSYKNPACVFQWFAISSFLVLSVAQGHPADFMPKEGLELSFLVF